ncbi:GNAT family N-acetyltransferase [Lysinibacillus sp. FSL W8-0992]|uniref:GNAT family N-acetyltransferase n=1 Tax=Lysinibacillus sp. FSL W8-0992 TaxID=2954643 RepID=UPI0030F70F0A
MLKLEHIIKLDIDYINSFSEMERCAQGVFFYNKEMPTYFDANHAHIWKKIEQEEKFLTDLKRFYTSKGLIPRMYLYNLEENHHCIEALQAHGFQYESFTDEVQCWNGVTVQLPVNPAIQIERVTNDNVQEALAVEMSISTFGEPAIIKEAFDKTYRSQHFTYYLLRMDGVACCTANIFVSGKQGRIESVATLENYRGKGLIGYLLQHIQKESVINRLNYLWILPISEQVANVYTKANFHSLGKITSIHAFTEGKSIQEIRSAK